MAEVHNLGGSPGFGQSKSILGLSDSPEMTILAKYLARYKTLPVAVKLLSPPLCIFLSLWTAGIVGFSLCTNHHLEMAARKETQNFASLLEQDLQRKLKVLNLKAQWISQENKIIEAIAAGDQAQLHSVLLAPQATLELDLMSVVAPNGQPLVSSQRNALGAATFQHATLRPNPQAEFASAGILLAKNTAPSALVSFKSIKSPTKKTLANLVLGIAIDDKLLNQIRSDTAMHLVAFQGDRVTASTLQFDRTKRWHFPQPSDAVTWIEIGNETYLIKTIELPGANQTTQKIAVLNSIQDLEQAEASMFFAAGSFGLLGAGLLAGSTIFGFQITQALSRRIQRLTQATQQLAAGNLHIHIPVTSEDEVGVLAQGFNQMAEQLTNRDQQLQQKMQELQNTLDQLHQAQSQMVQSEKLSALGQMVAGIAHEINNPVTFIHGNLTYLDRYTQDLVRLIQTYQQHYPQPPQSLQADLDSVELDFLIEDLTKILKSMHIGSERIRDIVISLRNFSRLDEAEFKTVDLHEGIDNTLIILQHRLKPKPGFPAIDIVKDYAQLPLVECYPGYLNQVFMNLLTNAIDAIEDAARQQAEAAEPVQPRSIWIATQVTPDNQIRITIADDGSGIPESVKARIFDPFFTTKPIGKGTGLGLSISHQIIIEKHHGKLLCDSIQGEGTKFVIEIPVHPSKPHV